MDELKMEDLLEYLSNDTLSMFNVAIEYANAYLREFHRLMDECRGSNMEIVHANQYRIRCVWEDYTEVSKCTMK